MSELPNEFRKRFSPAALDVLDAAESVECLRIETMAAWRRRLKMIGRSGFYTSLVFRRLMGFEDHWLPEEELIRTLDIQPMGMILGDAVIGRGPRSDVRLARDLARALLDDETHA